ncbi:Multidrug resistance protein mdtC [Lysobacter enzymogenes]|uniref:Multidrug resistance protein mdtC n=1 Tax=Lysobacter enzymogenes TaxID=69 RepID=A0A0S2DFS9_LYSEN|nr:efflux RND transporter permease subunit [Lysobacter enzymogenes]ALN57460.1 Multidrug resistance protein mdtC [Lysobacter enzymogenes]QCW26062.1 efflux RND transporter permease subunit [Lysobacter enzymogenes]
MRKSLSAWSIGNPIPSILLFALLTIAGMLAFLELPITNMPNVAMPVVTVQLVQPGAPPSEIENQITRKVEGSLASLQGVRHVSSKIVEGVSLTTIEFALETDIDRAVNDTRDAVAKVRNQLPTTMEEPVVQRSEDNGEAILVYSVEAPEMSAEELSWFIDDSLHRELLSIVGVARVQRGGGIDREIGVTLDPATLSALGVTAAEVSRQLAQTQTDVPGGRVLLQGTEYALRTVGRAATVEQLRELRIAVPGGREVKLGDLGTVANGGAEARSVTRLDGRPAVTFSVYKSRAASEVSVARTVQQRLDELQQRRGDLKFRRIFSLVELTETGFRSTMYTFLEGTLLTVLVVFAFLRDRRATAIAALTIPLSIIPTFLCMQWLGFTLNFVSLVAVSLVTGVLVDDAIVEIENIHRHMREGRGPREAALVASDEIGLAVVATTLVICAVFLPVGLMDGLPGQYFKQFGLTVAIAAFFSLAVARLITPMLASRLLRMPRHGHEEGDGPWTRRYLAAVEWTLRHRLKTVAIAVATLVASFALVPLLPSGFMPYQDFGQASVSVELPRGSSLADTDAAAQQVARILKSRPEVAYALTTAGTGDGGVNRATVLAKLVPARERALDERAFGNAMLPQLEALPDLRARFDNATGSKDLTLSLVSEDPAELARAAEALERQMRGLKGLSSVASDSGQQQPEITVNVDSAKAAQLGITAQQIGDAINISTIGDNDNRLAKFDYDHRQVPIRVRLPREFGRDLGVLENLKLATADGGSVPLAAVATLRFGVGPTTIERYDRQRRIDLSANLDGIALGTALERIRALPAMRELPRSVSVLDTGDAEFMGELMASFLKAIGAGLLLVYSVQVLLYRDWLQPLTRMAALPLSIGGAFALMFLTGTEFGLPAMIGVLMLMGIADKNSILLVDYMLERMRAGAPRREAIVEACRVRARPIVMTSLAMAAGMLPTAIGAGLDAAFRAPMAIAVIGGLVSSTALSLVFMPVLFSCMRDVEEWLWARWRTHDAPPQPQPAAS